MLCRAHIWMKNSKREGTGLTTSHGPQADLQSAHWRVDWVVIMLDQLWRSCHNKSWLVNSQSKFWSTVHVICHSVFQETFERKRNAKAEIRKMESFAKGEVQEDGILCKRWSVGKWNPLQKVKHRKMESFAKGEVQEDGILCKRWGVGRWNPLQKVRRRKMESFAKGGACKTRSWPAPGLREKLW